MQKRQSDKLNMYESVKLVTSDASLVWATYLPYVNAEAKLTLNIGKIFDAVQDQERLIKGYAREKEELRFALATSAITISGKIQGYATDQDDDVLYEEMDYVETDFMQGKSNLAAVFGKAVLDKATELDALLLPYGVTDADRTDLGEAITNYKEFISKPRQAIVDVKTATAKIAKLFKETDALLKSKMDKLMKNFKISAPDFYTNYFNARKIVNSASNLTEIRALIKSKTDHSLLSNVEMIVSNATKTYTSISDIAGIADAKQISPEMYNVKFVLPGFKELDVPNVSVGSGELELLSVEMEPL